MSLITSTGKCVLGKEEIEIVIKKIKETEKNLLRVISEKGAILDFYSKLRERLAEFNEITPADFIARANGVIDALRSDAGKINITYARKYDGLERVILMIAASIFPFKFYEEVEKLSR